MSRDPKPEAGARKTFLERVRRIPAKGWILFGFFLALGTAMAIHTALTAKDATLRVKVQHNFRSVQLSIWVDGELEYSGKLYGYAKKKLGVLPDVQGTFSSIVPITPGEHEVRVQTQADDGSSQEDAIQGDFVRGGQRTLAVVARHDHVALDWQGTATSQEEPAPMASSGGIGRYLGSLMTTLVGSIISALVGFALREFPNRLGSRAEAVVKSQAASAGR